MISAIGFHAFFIGMALGVMRHSGDIVALIVGIILHNWAESLSIGASLTKRH